MVRPAKVVRERLSALERVLARSTELCERATHVVAAIRQCAAPFCADVGLMHAQVCDSNGGEQGGNH